VTVLGCLDAYHYYITPHITPTITESFHPRCCWFGCLPCCGARALLLRLSVVCVLCCVHTNMFALFSHRLPSHSRLCLCFFFCFLLSQVPHSHFHSFSCLRFIPRLPSHSRLCLCFFFPTHLPALAFTLVVFYPIFFWDGRVVNMLPWGTLPTRLSLP